MYDGQEILETLVGRIMAGGIRLYGGKIVGRDTLNFSSNLTLYAGCDGGDGIICLSNDLLSCIDDPG